MIIEASHEDKGVDILVRISLDCYRAREGLHLGMNEQLHRLFLTNVFSSGGTDYKIGRSLTQLTGLESGHPETEAEQHRKII